MIINTVRDGDVIRFAYKDTFYGVKLNDSVRWPNLDNGIFQSDEMMYLRTRGRVFLDTEARGFRCYVGGDKFNLNAYGTSLSLAINWAVEVLHGQLQKKQTFFIVNTKRTFQDHHKDFDVTGEIGLSVLKNYGDITIDYDTTYAGPGTYQNPYWHYKCWLSRRPKPLSGFCLETCGRTIPKMLINLMKAMSMDWTKHYDIDTA